MIDPIIGFGARRFEDVLKAGRRKAFRLGMTRFPKKGNRLLDIDDVVAEVKPRSETYLGVDEIPVHKIIGTEGRSEDFTVSFLPISPQLEFRWNTVRNLMLKAEIAESIKVIEFGGFYFVRDGNHRVSVAKSHRIEYLDAEVTRYGLPVRLPSAMTIEKIPNLKAKLDFYDNTRLFDTIPEEEFGDAHPETWQKLEKIYQDRIIDRYREHETDSPNKEALIQTWYNDVFQNLMALIRRRYLPTLLADMYDLDIFCDILRLWEQLPPNTAPVEAFRLYIANNEKRSILFKLHHSFLLLFRRMTSTAQDEKQLFLRTTRLNIVCPNARVHEGKKDWYRFLRRQVLRSHLGYLRQKLRRRPFYDELAKSWYENHYKPAVDLYEERNIDIPFPVFFMRWMKSREKQVIRAIKKWGYVKDISLEESLEIYLKGETTESETGLPGPKRKDPLL